jgi:hypothetical protein
MSLQEKLQSKFLFILYLITSVHFILNFIGSPALKIFYVFEIVYIFSVLAIFPFRYSFPFLLYLLFIDGQGRILWEYNPLFRNIFDLACMLAILKSVSLKNLKYPIHKIPHAVSIALLLHLAWYVVQLFNFNSVGMVGVLAATKIYIFPFLLFIFFLNNPLEAEDPAVKKGLYYFLVLIILECVLVYTQMSLREDHLYKISSYYHMPIKDIFYGAAFRAFATTHLPGGLSVYLALSVGLFFIPKTKDKLFKFLFLLALMGSIFSLFLLQVRANFIKYLLVVATFYILKLILFPDRKSTFIKFSLASVLLSFFAIFIYLKGEETFKDLDLRYSITRISYLFENREVSRYRGSFNEIFDVSLKKLKEAPLGLGPGRTGAANSVAYDFIKNDPLYDHNYTWSYDNLFVSLIIDLGLGMVFYSYIIIAIPLTLLFAVFQKRHRQRQNDRLLISATASIFMLIGSWGALSIPYNPESFFFWFFCALGLNAHLDHEQTN